MESQSKHPVDLCAEILKTTLEGLGERLGVSKGAVAQWKLRGRVVPADHCPKLERWTTEAGRPVLCEQMNDRVDWAYIRAAANAEHQAGPAEARA